MELLPKKVILDTDIGPDCDDAAALALLNLYANRGWVDALCVTHCTSNPHGVGAIRAIDDWYGHDWPVGTMTRSGFLADEAAMRYNRALSDTVSSERRAAPAAVALLRETLMRQPDGSVELIAIGPLRNIADLLDSAPDAFSPMSGEALCAAKCTGITLMAGCFPLDESAGDPPLDSESNPVATLPKAEWNIEMDVAAARTVAEKWHGDMTYCGFEVGIRLLSGAIMAERLPFAHPVRAAYRLYNGAKNRPSWDLATVQYACMPKCDATVRGEPGVITVSETGETRFTPRPDGRHFYLKLAVPPEQAAAELDEWLVMEK